MKNNTQHKLTYEEVCHIRLVYKPRDPNYGAVALSKKYNVHRKTISRVVLVQHWKEGDDDHVKSKSI